MAHVHPVYDTDPHFVIDKTTGVIKNTGNKRTLRRGAHNSERFTFELPSEIEGHDMTLCDKIEIHYTNTDAATKETSKNVYRVKDMAIDSVNLDTITFSWLISKYATRYAGSLSFSIKFICTGDETTPEYVWPTAIHTGITVVDSVDNGEEVITEHSDILADWESKIDDSSLTDDEYNALVEELQ